MSLVGYWVFRSLGVAVLRELPLLLISHGLPFDFEQDVLSAKVFAGSGVPPQPGVVTSAWLWGGVGDEPPPP